MSPAIHGLLLASASPRRQELARWLGLPLRVQPARVDETPMPGETPEDYVARLAQTKAHAVGTIPARWVVLAADTAVVLEGRILGKPATPQEAQAMLQALRGRRHRVLTGFTLRPWDDAWEHTEVVSTQVYMRDYTQGEIHQYITSGAALDKAGAYGIQDRPFQPVARLGPVACFANVVGLPVCHVLRALHRRTGVPLRPITARCREAWQYHCPVPEALRER